MIRVPNNFDAAKALAPRFGFESKACGKCGAVYATEADWKLLEHKGDQLVPADEYGPATRCELRNCPCGMTFAIEYPA